MLTILGFIVVLGPLILFHELGHFVAAKLTGVRVEEFGLGWPPRLFKFWQSPSRLTVGGMPVVAPRNAKLPLGLEPGQHVVITAGREGEGAYALKSLRVLNPKTDDLTPMREEHVVITAGREEEGAYALKSLRVLNPKTDDLTPMREELDHGVRVRGQLTHLDLGTAYTVNWIPLGGFCRMTGEEDPSDPRSLAAQPKRERLAVLLSGPLTNLLLAILLFSISFLSGIPEPTQTRVTVLEISPGSPAAEVGLQPDDVILETDGIAVATTRELVDYIDAHAGQTISLTVERNGTVFEQAVWIRAGRVTGGRLGISIFDRGVNFVTQRSSASEALGRGVDQFWFSFRQMVELPAMLIRGEVSAEEVKPLGPLGISQMASDAIERSNEEQSWFTILFFAGAISMALGFTNLLPLPALDGGRILFVLIEAVRGRRIDPAKEGIVHLIGMAVLLGLLFLVTIQELINPISSPF